MRILFTTQKPQASTAGLGHFHPLVPLARASEEAGHEVAFACARSMRPMVERVGFRAFPAGRDDDSDPEVGEIKASAMKGETTMAVIDQHLTRWQSFWGSLDGSPQEVFWDADPVREADDLKNFQDHFDPALPVLDAGCGDGALTRLLANHFDRVFGTELAPAAVERARLAKSPRAISYRVLDLRHPDEAATLHEEIGDTNLYIRGVLQAIEPEQREPAARSIELLLGEAGTLYLKELSPASVTYFADLVARNGMPPTLARAPRPHTISEADLRVLFPPDHFHWIDTGSSYIFTKTVLPSGEVVSVPAIWAVLRRRSSQSRLPGRPARTGEGRGARREVWSPASRRD